MEVKNFDLVRPGGVSDLVRSIANQAIKRQPNLPAGSTQSVVVDIRGFDVPQALQDNIALRVEQRTGGLIKAGDVEFKEN